MKNLLLILFGVFAVLQVACSSRQAYYRHRKRFTQNWRFHLGDIENGQAPGLSDTAWRLLDLPHDWSIEGSFSKDYPAGPGGGALPGGIGWYRKSFTISASDPAKMYFIDFDGIYRDSKVWINGHFLGERPYGYSSFRYDLTPYLHYGDQENVVAVRVNNSRQPNSRWYSGSGIYRNVWLVITNKLHVDHWGSHITTPKVSKTEATVEIRTSVKNQETRPKDISLTTVIYDSTDREVARNTSPRRAIDSTLTITQQLQVENPRLWSVDRPARYRAETRVKSQGKIVDRYQTTFGIRKFHFDRERGFFLNGRHLKILGVCEHHDLGALGAAVNKRAIERRLEMLKNMGVNAIRTSHNPPSPELLQLTDKMGFIVLDEAFDAWKKNKTQYGYYQVWDQWHKQDLQDMVRRDRNHPSVMIWSIGNEILEQWDSTGTRIAKELAGLVRALDKTRPITSALNGPRPDNFIYRSGALDLVGFNYHRELFDRFPDDFPHDKFIATETTSALATRGAYDMPSDSVRRWPIAWDKPFTQGNDDYTVSSYDNVSTPWGSTHEEGWAAIKGKDYLSGMFIWTGFDYLGEPTPYGWPARSSYFGAIDLAGFPKDAYYMYQSEWTDKPVLHLFPHWNWQKGDTVDVWTYASADSVELFLNGKSLGIRTKPKNKFHMRWRVPYQPGTIRAVAITNGKQTLEKEIHTVGEAAKLVLSADRTQITANRRDLSYIKVEVQDKDGNIVPRANNEIHFELNGPGQLVGVSNGYEASHESFKANHHKAFNGLCRAIVESRDKPGTVSLTARSEGLESATINISVQ